MSPNEAQLRAALRDGEGQTLDVNHVITGATRARRARRQRVASVAGAVVVVGAVAVGAVALNGGNTPKTGTTLGQRKAPSAYAPVVPRPQASSANAPAATSAATGTTGATGVTACPSSLPRLLLPGGGGTGGFGSSGAVFASPVASIRLCIYQGDVLFRAEDSPAEVLRGSAATAWAASLESAATTRAGRACPQATTGADPVSLAMYATTRSGAALPVVTAVLGCPGLVTNGTAARYFWSPPTTIPASTLIPRASAPHTR